MRPYTRSRSRQTSGGPEPVAHTENQSPARAHTPRSLIVTAYGLYAREAGAWLSVAAVIRLMAACGVDAPAVRSAIFRLKRRNLLKAQKVEGAAGYALPSDAIQILREGDRRIFERRRATMSDGWILAVFSVPEAEREKRHQIRSRLSWLGFGTVAAGLWIAPAHLLGESRAVVTRTGLDAYVTLFEARYVGFAELKTMVPLWWDLPRLDSLYGDFLARYEPLLAAYPTGVETDPERTFADYMTVLNDWRRLPYLDPGLPTDLLPPTWHGIAAAETFEALHERLSGPAHDYASSVLRAP